MAGKASTRMRALVTPDSVEYKVLGVMADGKSRRKHDIEIALGSKISSKVLANLRAKHMFKVDDKAYALDPDYATPSIEPVVGTKLAYTYIHYHGDCNKYVRFFKVKREKAKRRGRRFFALQPVSVTRTTKPIGSTGTTSEHVPQWDKPQEDDETLVMDTDGTLSVRDLGMGTVSVYDATKVYESRFMFF